MCAGRPAAIWAGHPPLESQRSRRPINSVIVRLVRALASEVALLATDVAGARLVPAARRATEGPALDRLLKSLDLLLVRSALVLELRVLSLQRLDRLGVLLDRLRPGSTVGLLHAKEDAEVKLGWQPTPRVGAEVLREVSDRHRLLSNEHLLPLLHPG